jgi:rhamnogalacturonyl hydrolase YesR
MVPPFLAYYGVVTRNQSLINEAVNQISLYRDNLYVSQQNLWMHVVQGSYQDLGFWATGQLTST